MMRRERNSNEAADCAIMKLKRRISWRSAMACPCSGQKIRHHLLIFDLLVWLVGILAIILTVNLF